MKLIVIALLCIALSAFVIARVPVGEFNLERLRGAAPLERLYTSCANIGGKFVLYGGRTGIRTFDNQVHEFEFADPAWHKVQVVKKTASEPLPSLAGHSLTPISDHEAILVGGRKSIFTVTNEVYKLDTQANTVTQMKTKGEILPKFHSHAAWYHNGTVYVFGGFDQSKKAINTLYALNLKTKTWKKIANTDSIPAVQGHTATITDSGVVYIFGGQVGAGSFNTDIYTYDCNKNKWNKLRTRSRAREWHSASLIGNYIYIIGGMNNKEIVDSVDVFDTISQRWLTHKPRGKFVSRHGHCAVADKDIIYVFGGSVSKSWHRGFSNDLYTLDTSPATREKHVDKTSLIEKTKRIILDINSNILSGSNVTSNSNPIENRIKSRILSRKEPDAFKTLVQRIRDWKEIGDLHFSVEQAKSRMEVLTDEMNVKIDDVKLAVTDFKSVQGNIEDTKTKAETILSDLEAAKDALDSVRIKRKQAEQVRSETASKIQRFEGEIVQIQEKKKTALRHLDDKKKQLKKKIHSQVQLRETLESGKSNQELDEKEEKRLVIEIESLSIKISQTIDEGEDHSKRILELEKLKKVLEMKLHRLNELKKKMKSIQELASSLNLQYHELIESQTDLYNEMKEYDDEKHNVKMDDVDKERELVWVDPALARARKNITTELKKVIEELAYLKSLMSTRNTKKREMTVQLSILKKQLSEVRERLAAFNENRSNSSAKIGELDGEVENMKLDIQEQESLINTLEGDKRTILTREKSAKMKLENHIRELKALQKLEQDCLKEFRDATNRLRAIYLELELSYNNGLESSRRVYNGRAEIEHNNKSFTDQMTRLDSAEKQLLNRLALLEQELIDCKTALEKLRKAKQDL